MLLRTSAFVLTALVAGTAIAAPETYKIDPSHTFPGFEVNHLGFSTSRGQFNKTDGTIVLDRATKTVKADIVIDTNSISTGVEKLDAHLKAVDFLDVAKFPTITFKSTSAKFNGDKLTSLDGNLTIHGVTKPVTLAVSAFHCGQHPFTKKDACGADATVTIKRTDFGVNYGVPAVGEMVKLVIQVEGHKQ